MSLAFHASPFENDSNYHENKNNNNNNLRARKKLANNKTQKRYQAINTEKVNSMLASIHNSSANDDELSDFNPPSKPVSMGVQNTILKEGMTNVSDVTAQSNQSPPEHPPHNMQMFNEDIDMNSIQTNYGDSENAEEYYRKMIPNYGPANRQLLASQHIQYPPNYGATNSSINKTNSITNSTNYAGNGDNILEKLNYMINLLEENHDERTGNVTEEVVLYSFLGIFIIFIADSFSRVGKYTR